MSRTFKTDPMWVKLNHPDRVDIIVYAEHDHSKGECDLPDSPTDNWGGVHNNRCWWNSETKGKNIFCGCDLCTGKTSRKIANKECRRKSNERRKSFKTDPEYYGDELDDRYNKSRDW